MVLRIYIPNDKLWETTVKTTCFHNSHNLTPRELTFPLPRHFWRWFSFSQGGICSFSGGNLPLLQNLTFQGWYCCVAPLTVLLLLDPPGSSMRHLVWWFNGSYLWMLPNPGGDFYSAAWGSTPKQIKLRNPKIGACLHSLKTWKYRVYHETLL